MYWQQLVLLLILACHSHALEGQVEVDQGGEVYTTRMPNVEWTFSAIHELLLQKKYQDAWRKVQNLRDHVTEITADGEHSVWDAIPERMLAKFGQSILPQDLSGKRNKLSQSSDVHTTNAISNLNTLSGVVHPDHRHQLSSKIVECLSDSLSNKKSLLVFGAGNMNDLNMSLIAPHADTIDLVDVRPEFVIRSLIVNYWDQPAIISKATVHYADVTAYPGDGNFMEFVTATMRDAMASISSIQDLELTSTEVHAHFLEAGLLEVGEGHVWKASPQYVGHPVVADKKFDCVVSSNIFSQLLVQLKNTIAKDQQMKGGVGGMAIFFGEELLLAQHIAFLRQHLLRSEDGGTGGRVLFFLDSPKAIVEHYIELMVSRLNGFGIQMPGMNEIQPWLMLKEMNEKWAWGVNFR